MRTRTVAVSSLALFLTTAALFAVTVFVPLYLQTTTGATPIQAGLLLAPAMLGIAVSTNLVGLAIARTGHYKRYPIIGLAAMVAALGLLAALAVHRSQSATAIVLVLFGLGFGMVGQVLIVAVQNGVDRAQLGVAMGITSFFRGLGGAVGAAVLGAVFAARTGTSATAAGLHHVGPAVRADVVHGVQAVFLCAAPIAAVALATVLLLREVPLAGREPSPPTQTKTPPPMPAGQAVPDGGR
jgi:MFS family permease